MNTAVRAGSRVQSIGHGTVETGEKGVLYCKGNLQLMWLLRSHAAVCRLFTTWRDVAHEFCTAMLLFLILLAAAAAVGVRHYYTYIKPR
jgi:hypothetical protein